MTVITGDLILVTDRPSAVTEVWIRAGETRTHDGGLIVDDHDRESVHDGWLEINVLPGPAILTLVSHGSVRNAIPIVVPDAEATSLEDAVNAAKLAQPSLKTWLEELSASILAGTKGPQGVRGPVGLQGPPGNPPYISGDTWWVEGVNTGIKASGPKGDPGIPPRIQGDTWWVGETNTGIPARGPEGPKGDPGPTGTLDLIDESVQTTIDTVVRPAIDGARDEALSQVDDAVEDAILGTGGDIVRDMVGFREVAADAETVWAHTTEGGHRLPLGYNSMGRLDDHARTAFQEDVANVYEIPAQGYSHAWVSEDGAVLLGIRTDGTITAPGLNLTSGPTGPADDLWVHRDGTIQPSGADMAQVTVWGSSTPNNLIPFIKTALSGFGVTVNDMAQGGEFIQHAAARMGAVRAIINPVTIPASGQVNVTSPNMPSSGNLLPIPGTLAGVPGTLGSVYSSLHFTRATSGDPVVIAEPTEFIPTAGPTMRDHVSILGAGKNNILSSGSAPLVIDYTDKMFDYLTPMHPRVLVLGMHSNTGTTNPADHEWAVTVNNHLRSRFGPLFIDLRQIVTSPDIWTQIGITPTQTDLDEQAAGNMPPSLGADNAHFNPTMNTFVAGLIRDRMVSLGWYQP